MCCSCHLLRGQGWEEEEGNRTNIQASAGDGPAQWGVVTMGGVVRMLSELWCWRVTANQEMLASTSS